MRKSLQKPLFAIFALISATGCTTTEVEQKQEERRRLSIEMFRELIEEGTLSPTDSMGDSFEALGTELGDDAYLKEVLETYRARKETVSEGQDVEVAEGGALEGDAVEKLEAPPGRGVEPLR